MTIPTQTLRRGTLLYHGSELDFPAGEISGPAWFSTDRRVAEHFSRGHRVITYRLDEDIALPLIRTKAEQEALAERHHLQLGCTEDLVDSLIHSRLTGWYIPDNYGPGQDDIVLRDTGNLSVVDDTHPFQEDDDADR